MIGRGIGHSVATSRDFLAGGLARLGVTPNMLTVLGMVTTLVAGVCYAAGSASGFAWTLKSASPQNAYLLLAGVLLLFACICDMLDGAVARAGGRGTRFGAFLDSTLDRYSDFVIYAGIAICFAWQQPANITFVLLGVVALFNSFMISYTRARAEALIDSCKVGYWQRGERSAAILIATFAYNVPALVLQQATLPLLTALRRAFYTRAVLSGKSPIVDPRQGGWWLKIRLWRWARMTVCYDIVTALNIAWLVFARIDASDPIRRFFDSRW